MSDSKTYTLHDMYRYYTQKVLAKNPGFYTKSDKFVRKKGIVFIMNQRGEVYMSYALFRNIIERVNKKACIELTRGETYDLGTDLGYLRARTIERDFSKPSINIIATMLYRREHPEDKETKIYYTDDYYCRIAWHKTGTMKNKSVYEFKPCYGFKLYFSKENCEDKGLKFKYLLFLRT